MKKTYLAFEEKVARIEEQIIEIERLGKKKGLDYSQEIINLQKEKVRELKKIYSNLNAWQVVKIARHPDRPVFKNYLESIVKDFRELCGDRFFGDDRAVITGLGKINRKKVMILGNNKKSTIKADKKIKELEEEYKFKIKKNKGLKKELEKDLEDKKKQLIEEEMRVKGGYSNPEGYRKALRKMKLAEKYNLPVITFIDTPGAYPGIGAEERGIAGAIAINLMEMSRLKVPIISIVIGEGGSGGALGIGVADKLAMLEFSYYSVISPEGCAAILWRDGKKAEEAAKALKLTSKDLYKLGLIDDIIEEPLGGAQRNYHDIFYNVEKYVDRTLRNLEKIELSELLDKRYDRLRNIGKLQKEKT